MVTVRDIYDYIDGFAPVSSKMDFDNAGLLVGDMDRTAERALLALDITDTVIAEAQELGADVIISHHPLFFSIKSVTEDDIIGRKIIALIKNDISAICMHTNLDAALGGVNDALAAAIGLKDTALLASDGSCGDGTTWGIGRYGYLASAMDIVSFAAHVKTALGASGVRYTDARAQVRKVAVVGGSGADHIAAALSCGCDAIVTADVKYNPFLDSLEMGIDIVDAGHFPTENVVIDPLCRRLASALPECEFTISLAHRQPEMFI